MPQPRKDLPPDALDALAVLAARQGGAVTRRQALDAGLTAAQIRTQVRRDGWLQGAGGVLVPDPSGAAVPHLRDAAVRLLQIERRAVISHASAAVLHGLPYVDTPHLPTLTVERPVRGEPGVFVAAFGPQDVTHVDGLPVMTPSRTLVDVMRTAPDRPRAQALSDGALRVGAGLGDVERVLRAATGWPGVRQAREAWEHADPRPESPLESRCRVWFRDSGLPAPELQVTVGDGRLVARLDFLFREQRTVVEADGRVKYAEPEVLWAEKQREDWLRDLGFEVVRATWADGRDGGADLVRRILRAFDRAALRAA